MTEPTMLPPEDLPELVDGCAAIQSVTETEQAEGNRLGASIDADDDEDAGFRPAAKSPSTALAKAQALKAALLAHGVPEVSIELQAGRPTSGDTWDCLRVMTNFFHHTVSRYSSGSLTPVLSLCKTGRTDVPGPLCNSYGGWDLCLRILTFGLANHPGTGGPVTVNGRTIPQDNARPYAWGTEFEGGLSAGDWDRTLTNPRNGKQMTFREFMGRSGAGIQDYFDLPITAHLEHSTWTTRKIDRLGYGPSPSRGIAEIQRYGGAPAGDWFDRASAADVARIVREELHAALL